jgi:hypothetical protein
LAGTHRPLVEMLFEAGLDMDRHPEVKAAEKPIDEAFLDCVRAISDADETRAANWLRRSRPRLMVTRDCSSTELSATERKQSGWQPIEQLERRWHWSRAAVCWADRRRTPLLWQRLVPPPGAADRAC